MKGSNRLTWLPVCGCLLGMCAWAWAAPYAVTTYHYDNSRTGWNSQETTLSASAFPASFGVLATVAVDDQVDAQPLLVPNETIAGAVHDVLYVATENNSVYALDAASGQILLHVNLGAPVPTPLGCGNNGPNVGITGTPVIDSALQRIYLIAYVNGASPQYELHALNLRTLADAVPPVTVAATHALTNGTVYAFNATYQRQRPALLELNGTIYAGFGSFCDFGASQSRGWVLGWSARTLKPLAGNELTDSQGTSPTDFFLTSVWMSGYGLAADSRAIYFSTGNSDCNWLATGDPCPPESTWNGVTHVQESVVRIEPNLTKLAGVFAPSNVLQLDREDLDLGAAGVLVVPSVPGSPELAAIVSKDGRLFLLNRQSLSSALDTYQLANGCWCGPAYYQGADGIQRIITSAGSLQTWQVSQSPSAHLVAESTTSTISASEQDPGFFTTVSSNGRNAGTAIIWAVGRPSTSPPVLTLYAFAAAPMNGALPLLYSAPAGQWPNLGGNANIVPVVANGRAYVGAYKTVTFFGPGGTAAAAAPAVAVNDRLAGGVSRVTGTLQSVNGSTLILLTRSGTNLRVDDSGAIANERMPRLVLGEAYTVVGPARDAAAASSATSSWRITSIVRAKPGQAAWPADQ